MDGLFVVGPMNVMLYHQYNTELKAKFVELAKESGLIEGQSLKASKVEKHIPKHPINNLLLSD